MKGTYIQGDCMQHLKNYADNHFDLAIVDPPYGIGISSSPRIVTDKGIKGKGWDNNRPTKEYFKELFRVSKNQIVWGWNYFSDLMPPCKGFIYWDKIKHSENWASGELAFCSIHKPAKCFSYMWCGNRYGFKGSINGVGQKSKRMHPTQKPVALYRWLLQNYAKPNDLILDTHVGSASSLIACEIEGFKYVGFEKDADYYKDSKKRLKQHLAQKVLF